MEILKTIISNVLPIFKANAVLAFSNNRENYFPRRFSSCKESLLVNESKHSYIKNNDTLMTSRIFWEKYFSLVISQMCLIFHIIVLFSFIILQWYIIFLKSTHRTDHKRHLYQHVKVTLIWRSALTELIFDRVLCCAHIYLPEENVIWNLLASPHMRNAAVS